MQLTASYQKSFEERDYAVFEVPLPDGRQVFMRYGLGLHMSRISAVVIVDSEKFLGLWRADRYRFHAHRNRGDASNWRKDPKFAAAENGFGSGRSTPVPLAYVSCLEHEVSIASYKFTWFGKTISRVSVPYVTYTNGVTRTLWLLANGCQQFPIAVEYHGAKLLQKHAGVSNSQVLTIDELLQCERMY